MDPTGMNAWKPGEIEGTWIAEPGDGAERLAKDAGTSRAKAYQVMDEHGYGTYIENGVTKSAVDPGDVVQLGGRKSGASSAPESTSFIGAMPANKRNSQDADNSSANRAAHNATVFGLVNLMKEGAITAVSKTGEVAPKVLNYTKIIGPLSAAYGVGASYLQYNEAFSNGDRLGVKRAQVRMASNSISWWFPVGTAAWAGVEVSLMLNPTMKDPQDAGWSDRRVCFVKGTLISTYAGDLPIETIEVGDSIISANEHTLNTGISIVKQIMKTKNVKLVYTIQLENGDILELSGSHPVYTRRNGWRSVQPKNRMPEHRGLSISKLEVGDEVMVLNENKRLTSVAITDIYTTGVKVYMYNLVRVEGDNTFFANKILVHNKFLAE